MTVRLRLFAQLKDVAKKDHLEIQVKEGATIGDLREAIKHQMPQLGKFMSSATFAVNDEYVGAEQILQDSMTVAIIPPISGG
jgi:molybdopterin converting factor subunit 1